MALARRLTAAGHGVREADSVKAAGSIDAAELGAAILDLELADGTGIDIARALRARRPDLDLAFFTADAGQETLTQARSLGPVFHKPDELDLVIAWASLKSCG